MSNDEMVVKATTAQQLERVKALNEKILQLQQQQHQFKMAIVECDQVKDDIKKGGITKVLVPTIGNNFIQINPKNEKYSKMLSERAKQFDNSLKGINEQLNHNSDLLNEAVLRLYKMLNEHIKSHGLEVPE